MNQREKREEGIRLLAAGKLPAEVSQRLEVALVTVYRWRGRATAERAARKSTSSRKAWLTQAEIKRLGELLDNNRPCKFKWGVPSRSGYFDLANVKLLVQNEFPLCHEATLSKTGLRGWLIRSGFAFHSRWMTLECQQARIEREADIKAARTGDAAACARLPEYLQQAVAFGKSLRESGLKL